MSMSQAAVSSDDYDYAKFDGGEDVNTFLSLRARIGK